MKKTFSSKNTKRFGGPKNHAFGETSARKKSPFPAKKFGPKAEGQEGRPARAGGRSSSAPGGRPSADRAEGRSAEGRTFKDRPAFGDKGPARKRSGERPEGRPVRSDARPARGEGRATSTRGEGRSAPARGEGRSSDRPEGRFSKDRAARPARPAFGEKKAFPASRAFAERSEGRVDRATRYDRADRPERAERSDRPERRFDRADRPAPRFNKDRDDRPARPAYGADRPAHRGEDSGDRKPRPTSSTRPTYGDKRSAHDKPFAKKPLDIPPARGAYVWGLHAVGEAWLNPDRRCFRLLVTEGARDNLLVQLEKAKEQGLARPDFKLVPRDMLDALLPEGSVHQGAVLDAAPLPELGLSDLIAEGKAPDLILVLDQVTDPHNVGAILRSAAAFGAGALIVTERNAPQATGVMAKVACGGLEHVKLISVTNLARTLEALSEAGYWRVGLAEEGAEDLAAQKLQSGKVALVMGAEGTGLRRLTRENCDALARLPTQPPIGSLNVSNAAAIALYEVRRGRVAGGE